MSRVDFAVFADGVDVDLLAGISSNARKLAATRAINSIAKKLRKRAADDIRAEVNFPARYVGAGERRLYVSKQAQRNDLEARISARARATSLARFVQGTPKLNKPGVYVEIEPGKARFLKRAFVIRLPAGKSGDLDTQGNLALAVRLRPGQTLKNKTTSRRVASGLYVLYGPSVSQVFRAASGKGVASDLAPQAAQDLQDEFLRLLELD